MKCLEKALKLSKLTPLLNKLWIACVVSDSDVAEMQFCCCCQWQQEFCNALCASVAVVVQPISLCPGEHTDFVSSNEMLCPYLNRKKTKTKKKTTLISQLSVYRRLPWTHFKRNKREESSCNLVFSKSKWFFCLFFIFHIIICSAHCPALLAMSNLDNALSFLPLCGCLCISSIIVFKWHK